MYIQPSNTYNITLKAAFIEDCIYTNLYKKANKTSEFKKTMKYFNSKCPQHELEIIKCQYPHKDVTDCILYTVKNRQTKQKNTFLTSTGSDGLEILLKSIINLKKTDFFKVSLAKKKKIKKSI